MTNEREARTHPWTWAEVSKLSPDAIVDLLNRLSWVRQKAEEAPPPAPPDEQMNGRVGKMFPEKGFGFVRSTEDGRQFFFHKSAVPDEPPPGGWNALREGMNVTFEVVESPRGLRAEKVRKVGLDVPPGGEDA